jgi:hypothetical protein
VAVNRGCRRSEIRRVFASGSCWVVRMLGDCCGEFDGVGVDRGVCIGVEFGRDAIRVMALPVLPPPPQAGHQPAAGTRSFTVSKGLGNRRTTLSADGRRRFKAGTVKGVAAAPVGGGCGHPRQALCRFPSLARAGAHDGPCGRWGERERDPIRKTAPRTRAGTARDSPARSGSGPQADPAKLPCCLRLRGPGWSAASSTAHSPSSPTGSKSGRYSTVPTLRRRRTAASGGLNADSPRPSRGDRGHRPVRCPAGCPAG